MTTPTSQPAVDDVFAEVAVSCGFMVPDQVQLCRDAVRDAQAHGRGQVTLSSVAFERKLLTAWQVETIEQVLMDRSLRPRLGGLEFIERIGGGGMGTVYKARQVGLDRIVAVKVIKPELAGDAQFVARFEREARLAAQIWHPKAIQVFDVGFDLGRHYMVMEYVDGVPLSEILHGPCMDEAWALQVIRDVAEPLGKAHSLGIIHRDIKPGNVLVGRDGTARLSDLGLAKSTLGRDELTLTHTGHAAGTPYYMSPEQCRGDREPDERTDIYSLGIMLFLMVCGRLPFEGPTPFVVMQKQLSEPLPNPLSINPSLSTAVAELIRDMTAKRRKDRLQTCGEVLARIAAILAVLPPAAVHELDTVVVRSKQSARPRELESPPASAAAPTPAQRPAATPERREPRRRSRRFGWIVALVVLFVLIRSGPGLFSPGLFNPVVTAVQNVWGAAHRVVNGFPPVSGALVNLCVGAIFVAAIVVLVHRLSRERDLHHTLARFAHWLHGTTAGLMRWLHDTLAGFLRWFHGKEGA